MRSIYLWFFLLFAGFAAIFAVRAVANANDGGEVTVLQGAKIYTSPSAPPIENGSVVVQNGKIISVGSGKPAGIPAGAKVNVIDCAGRTITAGFQNSHVHFTEAKWDHAAGQLPAKLTAQMQEMLTRYGVTTAVDLSSNLQNTVALRARVESGEVAGPRILTAGAGLFPPDGLPFYVRDSLPVEIQKVLPQPATPAEAVKIVQLEMAGGSDVLKLFTGSLISRQEVKPMPVDIARAAADEAHRNGRLVFAHPSNMAGIQVAMDAHVDVLAHTTPIIGPWDAALIAKMLAIPMSLTPTLKLWEVEAGKDGATAAQGRGFAEKGVAQLKTFSEAGGQVLFGTDVGYITDYDTTEEYLLMKDAGLTPMQILASLTTAPAARFKESNRRGPIAAGMDADLVVLAADPQQDVSNFAKVQMTMRAGKVIYKSASN